MTTEREQELLDKINHMGKAIEELHRQLHEANQKSRKLYSAEYKLRKMTKERNKLRKVLLTQLLK